jgi:hypothetical protein
MRKVTEYKMDAKQILPLGARKGHQNTSLNGLTRN